LLHPVGYDIGVPVVVPTILYLILNSRPVVGLEVMKPIAASARRTTPVDVFVEFARTKVPCPEKTLPAVLTPTGLITAGSA